MMERANSPYLGYHLFKPIAGVSIHNEQSFKLLL